MKTRLFSIGFLVWLTALLAVTKPVLAKSYIAYISDSTSSSVIYWLAKEAGIFKNMGWIWIRSLSTAAFAEFKSLIAGDLGYSGAVGTAVINANLAQRTSPSFRAR